MVTPKVRWKQPQKPGKRNLGGTGMFLYLQDPTREFGPGGRRSRVGLKLV